MNISNKVFAPSMLLPNDRQIQKHLSKIGNGVYLRGCGTAFASVDR